MGCFVFFGTLVIAKEEETYQGSVPLVTFGALTAAIIAVFTIASGAIILVPTLLWSIGLISTIDTVTYKLVWWAMGMTLSLTKKHLPQKPGRSPLPRLMNLA